MAKNRRASKPKDTQVSDSTATGSQTSNSTSTQGERKMGSLTPDQIAALLSGSRTKGQYTQYLADFIESGEGGVCVNEQWADLAGKKSATLKQGFENAKSNKNAPEGSEGIRVMVNEEKVYLINLVAAGVAAESGDDE